MNEFKLLTPHEVLARWSSLRTLLANALATAKGELEVDDIRQLVLSGRMFIFADKNFAVTCEFMFYPKKTAMLVGFGAGKVPDRLRVEALLTEFAHRGGATSIQTYCSNPAMIRYYRRWFQMEPTYTLLEKQL